MTLIKKEINKIYKYKIQIFIGIVIMAIISSAVCIYKYKKHSNAIEYDINSFYTTNAFNGEVNENGFVISPSEESGEERNFCAESSYTLLQKGKYTIALAYNSDADNSVFIQAGDSVYKEFSLPAGSHIEYLDFELPQSVEDARARFYYGGSGTLTINTMILTSEKPIVTDWLFIMMLIWIAIAGVFALSNMYLDAKINKEHVLEILFVLLISALSVPYIILATKGIIYGVDTNGQNLRIEGLKDALLGGQFPVVIMPSMCNGYGSIEPMMYPSLFLYPFAILRILNVSPVLVSKFAHVIINLLMCATCYVCAKKITRSRKGAGIALIAFAFSKFHLTTIGSSDWTYGMGIAAIFFFVVLIGVYEIFLGEKRVWPYLTIGMWGIMNSHIITSLFAAFVVGVFALVYLKKAYKEDRIRYFIYAVISSIFACLYRLYTFLDAYINNDLNTASLNLGVYKQCVFDIKAALSNPLTFFVVAGTLILLVYLCVISNKGSNGNKFAITSMGVSLICITIMSAYLPWNKIFTYSFADSLFGFIQFPTRLMQIVVPLIAISLGIAYRNLKRNNSVMYVGCRILLISLVCVSSVWGYANESAELSLRGQSFTTKIMGDVLSFDGMTDYVPAGETKESFSGRTPYYSGGGVSIIEETYRKNGININCDVVCTEDDSYVDFPIFGYKGYVCEDTTGGRLLTSVGEKSRLRVYFDKSDEPVNIRIYYNVPVIYYILLFISYFSMFVMITVNRKFLARIKQKTMYYERLYRPLEFLEGLGNATLGQNAYFINGKMRS